MNKVNLIGRLTNDPTVRYTNTNNTMVVSFTLAVNKKFIKSEEEKKADFIFITAWGKTAEFCSKYFSKGQQVGISGRLEQREYEDKDGKKVNKTQVIAEEVDFAGEKKEGNKDIKEQPTFNSNSDVSEYSYENSDDLPF